MKYQLELDTGGHCLICLRALQIQATLKPIDVNNGQDNSALRTGRIFSFRNLCRYLEIARKNILGEALPVPLLGEAVIKGPLCEKCVPHLETFSKLFRELEAVQMKLQSCVESIYDVMVKVDNDENAGKDPNTALNEFKRKMLSSPGTLPQYGIVTRLRDNILEKASKLTKYKVLPRVILKKVDHSHPPNKVKQTQIVEKKPLQLPLALNGSSSIDETHMDVDINPMALIKTHIPTGDNTLNLANPEGVSLTNRESNLSSSTDNHVPLDPACYGEYALLECDICHHKVLDLSTHLYTVHFDTTQNVGEASQETTGIGGALGQSRLETEANAIYSGVQHQDHHPLPLVEKFTCYYCKKEFRRKSKLVKHREKTHFSRPYQCKLCFDWFSSKSDVARHKGRTCPLRNPRVIWTLNPDPIHSGTGTITSSSVSTAIYPNECDICHMHFISSQAVDRHHHDDHQGYKFMCDLCHARFFSKCSRDTHVKGKCPKRTYITFSLPSFRSGDCRIIVKPKPTVEKLADTYKIE